MKIEFLYGRVLLFFIFYRSFDASDKVFNGTFCSSSWWGYCELQEWWIIINYYSQSFFLWFVCQVLNHWSLRLLDGIDCTCQLVKYFMNQFCNLKIYYFMTYKKRKFIQAFFLLQLLSRLLCSIMISDHSQVFSIKCWWK